MSALYICRIEFNVEEQWCMGLSLSLSLSLALHKNNAYWFYWRNRKVNEIELRLSAVVVLSVNTGARRKIIALNNIVERRERERNTVCKTTEQRSNTDVSVLMCATSNGQRCIFSCSSRQYLTICVHADDEPQAERSEAVKISFNIHSRMCLSPAVSHFSRTLPDETTTMAGGISVVRLISKVRGGEIAVDRIITGRVVSLVFNLYDW